MSIHRENFINVQGWMVTELGLSGNELLIYAMIHGITQDGQSRYNGGLKYLGEWLSSSKQTVINNLKSLCEKGLIIKEERIVNNVKFCEYYVSALADKESSDSDNDFDQGSKNLNGVVKKFERGGQKILPNNKYYNKPNNKISTTSTDSDCRTDVVEDEKRADEEKPMGEVCLSGNEDHPENMSGKIDKIIKEWNTLSEYSINQVSSVQHKSNRHELITRLLRQYGADSILKAIDNIRHSKYLQGKNKNVWVITFDWFILPDNFAKVLEGNYKDRTGSDKICKHTTGKKDLEALEKLLLTN